MSWFEKIVPSRIKTERRSRSVPEGLWIKCPACDAVLYRAELERNLNVCPKCSHHMRIGARERLRALLDPEPISEIGAGVMPDDPLKFKDSRRYRDRLAQAQKTTRESDALVALAGPASNIVMAVLLAAVAIATIRIAPALSGFAQRGVLLSIYLALFNLLPVPPLDGSKLLLAARIPIAIYHELARAGFLLLVVLMVATSLGRYLSLWSVLAADAIFRALAVVL